MEDTDNTANDQSKGQDSEVHEPATSQRDLGTAGGGTIPKGGTGNSPGGISTSNSNVNGSASSGVVGDTGETSVRGSNTDKSVTQQIPESHGAGKNTIDPSAQSSIGGRSPGQPQTAMGDQDGRSSAAQRDYKNIASDPMGARTPDKVAHEEKE